VKKVDLHIHSKYSSDGELAPDIIIDELKKLGFFALSITDHDSMDAYPYASDKGKELGVEVIKGVELTTGYKGRETHILAYFIEETRAATIIKRIQNTRIELTLRRLEKLKKLGMPISIDEVMERSQGKPPTGPIIAEIAISKFSLKSYKENPDPIRSFYTDYFLPGRPAYVERVYMSSSDVIRELREIKSVPVLAHPGAFIPFTEEEIKELVESGLMGIEVRNTYHSEKQVDFYRGLALKFSLVPTCGSDFHGRRKPKIRLGDVFCDYEIVEELKRARDEL